MTLKMENVKVINLTRPITPLKDPVSPDDITAAVLDEGLIWPLFEYSNYIDDSVAQIVKLKTHLKTHIESPYHLNHCGRSLDEYPLSTFVGRLVNMEFDVEANTVIDLEMFEKIDNGRIKKGDIVVAHSTVDKKYHPVGYGITNPVKMPGFHPDIANYCIKKGIKLFGIDQSMSFEPEIEGTEERAHDLFLQNDIPLIEMLADLDQLTQPVSFMAAIPGLVAIKGIDSSTTPVVALEGFEVE